MNVWSIACYYCYTTSNDQCKGHR
uniref:Uncharacterized protein n=1 Tax=Arundo donax TaxID=35708 RepID=A0A0A9H9L0_ARUDO